MDVDVEADANLRRKTGEEEVEEEKEQERKGGRDEKGPGRLRKETEINAKDLQLPRGRGNTSRRATAPVFEKPTREPRRREWRR